VPRPWWHDKRRIAIAIVVAVLVSVFVANRAFATGGSHYRSATVTARSIDATLTGVATIEPTSQASVAFPVSGTVASVGVKVGDPVTVGETVATLDGKSLQATLDSKQATLAQAQLTLQQALSGQQTTRSSGAGTSGASSSSSSGGTSSLSSSGSSATQQSLRLGKGDTGAVALLSLYLASTDPDVAAKQQAVIQAQQAVDAAIAAASNATSSATTVCAAMSSPPTSAELTACQTALSAVSSAQHAVKSAQDALVSASNALDALLEQRANASPPTTTPATSAPPSSTSRGTGGSGLSGGTAGGGAAAGGGSSPSAADLASDQKAVDAAYAQVAVAQHALSQAIVATPIDGTVVAVHLAVGDTVTAASSTANIVVQGPGGYEVSTTISVDRIPEVRVGQAATVVPDGTDRAIPGKVAYVSVVPESSGTTTSYLVVVGLSKNKARLNNGSGGTTSIVTDHATAALAVPSSAVRTTGARHTVDVLDGDTTKTVGVNVGVVGERWTEITKGLAPGQQVALADLSQALPGSATSSSTGTTRPGGLGGVFPGGFGGANGIRGG
jgi:multidrug efflux pump subunit AcrA (membrane-fusion protein)